MDVFRKEEKRRERKKREECQRQAEIVVDENEKRTIKSVRSLLL